VKEEMVRNHREGSLPFLERGQRPPLIPNHQSLQKEKEEKEKSV
jgi:hypothetical protein